MIMQIIKDLIRINYNCQMLADSQLGKEDLLTLNDFSEESVLESVMARFKEQGKTFTAIGAPIIISVNPF